MDIFINFKDLFLSVWEKGILGIDIFEILIGLGIFLVFLIFRGLISRLIIKKLELRGPIIDESPSPKIKSGVEPPTPMVTSAENLPSPTTSNFLPGLVVPMPTLPELDIAIFGVRTLSDSNLVANMILPPT